MPSVDDRTYGKRGGALEDGSRLVVATIPVLNGITEEEADTFDIDLPGRIEATVCTS